MLGIHNITRMRCRKNFVDSIINSLKESTDKKIVDTLTTLGKMLSNGLKKRTHIITASASVI